ncbi:MAG: rod shape-determining protein RodA, partial [Deltaproteobacteria bacterium]|nr:rod shape-determining protein RodA [Deltaproteobacteria bacterium]
PGVYTMRSLFRPLNLSRPLAALGLLIASWKKPLLSDPVGELARAVRAQVGGAPPQLGDLLWFRLLLLAGVLALAAGGVLLINQTARQRALLDPWPPGRRGMFVFLWLLLIGAGVALIAYAWNAPFLRDPFGALITRLAQAAGPHGAYATLSAGYGLRVMLALAVALYLAAAVWHARNAADPLVDLLIAPIDLVLFPALLVLVQPDLGTAGIIVLIGLSVIFVVGIRLRTLVIMGVLAACTSVVGWFGILKDYQKLRILMLIDPDQDRKGAGWNVVQSLIAVGSGRWTGKGHLEGTQSQLAFLPEQHTDFAFSVWAEEQGFLGSLLVLALYAAFLLMALAVAAEARDAYGSLLAAGVVALVFWQTVINVGMVIGLLPVVGLTLPLFSYGGSSLVTVLIGCGLLLSVRQHRRAF